MKFYLQFLQSGNPCFDVVWGEKMKENETLAIVQKGKKWVIIDIASGVIVGGTFKTKKSAIEWYNNQNIDDALLERIAYARNTHLHNKRLLAMSRNKILNAGDRVSYIDIKNSVILDLIKYIPEDDAWIVEDEWHQFTISPDRIIKLSEVK